MILYLSSYGFGNQVEQLRNLVSGPRRAAVIANALDFSTDLARKEANVDAAIVRLQELEFAASEIDLKDYFGKPEGLRRELEEFGLIWTLGGNSFLLRSAMRQSGFDSYLLAKQESNLVYGGYSAGIVVVTPTLKGTHLVDPPDAVPQSYGNEILWSGLSLVPYCIAPHYDSQHPESELINHVIEYYQCRRMSFEKLRDGEVIIVRITRGSECSEFYNN